MKKGHGRDSNSVQELAAAFLIRYTSGLFPWAFCPESVRRQKGHHRLLCYRYTTVAMNIVNGCGHWRRSANPTVAIQISCMKCELTFSFHHFLNVSPGSSGTQITDQPHESKAEKDKDEADELFAPFFLMELRDEARPGYVYEPPRGERKQEG